MYHQFFSSIHTDELLKEVHYLRHEVEKQKNRANKYQKKFYNQNKQMTRLQSRKMRGPLKAKKYLQKTLPDNLPRETQVLIEIVRENGSRKPKVRSQFY